MQVRFPSIGDPQQDHATCVYAEGDSGGCERVKSFIKVSSLDILPVLMDCCLHAAPKQLQSNESQRGHCSKPLTPLFTVLYCCTRLNLLSSNAWKRRLSAGDL